MDLQITITGIDFNRTLEGAGATVIAIPFSGYEREQELVLSFDLESDEQLIIALANQYVNRPVWVTERQVKGRTVTITLTERPY